MRDGHPHLWAAMLDGRAILLRCMAGHYIPKRPDTSPGVIRDAIPTPREPAWVHLLQSRRLLKAATKTAAWQQWSRLKLLGGMRGGVGGVGWGGMCDGTVFRQVGEVP